MEQSSIDDHHDESPASDVGAESEPATEPESTTDAQEDASGGGDGIERDPDGTPRYGRDGRLTARAAFPFPSYYEGQQRALHEASKKLWSDDVDVLILDLPTGTGKSPINTALCRQAESAFYTTPQKNLRQQLADDDGLAPYMEALRARADYMCGACDTSIDCGSCPINNSDDDSCLNHSYEAATNPPAINSREAPSGPSSPDASCRYWDAKVRAMNADIATITFSYLIIDSMLPTMTPGSQETPPRQVSFKDRELLVVDESHKLESQVASMHAGRNITSRGLPGSVQRQLEAINTRDLGEADRPTVDLIADELRNAAAMATFYLSAYVGTNPVFDGPTAPTQMGRSDEPENPLGWLRTQVENGPAMRTLTGYMDAVEETVRDRVGDADEGETPYSVPEGIPECLGLVKALGWLFSRWEGEDGDEVWVVGDATMDGEEGLRLSLQPVDVGPFLKEMVWRRADKIVLSTATMRRRDDPEAWLRRLGLDGRSYSVVTRDMNYDVANRPIHMDTTVGTITGGGFGGFREQIADRLGDIFDKHPGEKGLIHTVSYNRAEELAKALTKRGYGDRVVLHRSGIDAPPSEVQLERWKEMPTESGAVYLSPSCMEGVDLEGDLCTFQALVKVPLPYLGDPRVSYITAEGDWRWYNEEALVDVVQSVGRGIRGPDDVCDYYVLDQKLKGDWKSLLSSVEPPQWFLDSLEAGRS